MAKKRVASASNIVSSPQDILVENLDDLVKVCRQALASALGQDNIGFKSVKEDVSGKTVYTLTAPGLTTAEAKYRYRVIPLLQFDERTFWLAVTLELQHKQGQLYLQNACIFLFEGSPEDQKKKALIRAEWDCPEFVGSSSHAQPHWHVYPSPLHKELEIFHPELGGESSGVRDFSVSQAVIVHESDLSAEWDRETRFHFAMASRWHIDGKSSQEVLALDKLQKWLNGCVSYIRSQLVFLYS